jgi:DNA-binding FrmR family transcriptional regulator
MIDEGRYCPDILTQMRAIRSALKSVEANILETHLEHCVTDVMEQGSKKKREEKIQEVKELFKRYND